MIEGRAIISGIENTRKKVEQLGAAFKGEYIFKDVIFILKQDDFNLSDDFLRMRVYSKNNWSTKNVVLVRKQTEFKSTGKINKIILKEEFDTEKEALDFVQENLSSEFKREFEFSRTGWQYQLANHRIFIEDVEGFKPSIEIEAETEDELKSLFDKIGILEKINESMPKIMRRIKI